MNQENPYAAPQTPLKSASDDQLQLPAVLLPFDFARGSRILLLTIWNPLIVLIPAICRSEGDVALGASVVFALSMRGYLPYCGYKSDGKYLFWSSLILTICSYSLFVATFLDAFSYRENALRNCLLLWLLSNVIFMIGIALVAREYRAWGLRNWSLVAAACSLLLQASVLPLQLKWIGFEILQQLFLWYYFIGFMFYVTNAGLHLRIIFTITDDIEKTKDD